MRLPVTIGESTEMREFTFSVEGDIIVAAHCQDDALEAARGLVDEVLTNCVISSRGTFTLVSSE